MRNEDFANALFSIAGMTDAEKLAASQRVYVSVFGEPLGADDAIGIELSISGQQFQVVMGGLDLPYDERPLTINHEPINDPAAKGVGCMLIETFIYDYNAYQESALA